VKYLRKALYLVVALGSIVGAYWAGYHAGLTAKGPDQRAIMIVRRGPGNSMGTSATWFDFHNPKDVARFDQEEKRLKAAGTEYYVAKGVIETTLSPEPDPRHVNSHR
jgi:hypothetical protein